MKNTAARVGPPEGARGTGRSGPREGRRAARPEDNTWDPSAPRWRKDVWPTRAIGQGSGLANLGPPHRGETGRSPDRYAPRQPRENRAAGPTAVPTEGRATKERA